MAVARRTENNALTFLRCRTCETGVAAITTAVAIRHEVDGTHTLEYPRPDHRTVSIWKDIRAAINHVHQVQFYLGLLPVKPQEMWDLEAIELQLADARAVLEQLEKALAEGADS